MEPMNKQLLNFPWISSTALIAGLSLGACGGDGAEPQAEPAPSTGPVITQPVQPVQPPAGPTGPSGGGDVVAPPVNSSPDVAPTQPAPSVPTESPSVTPPPASSPVGPTPTTPSETPTSDTPTPTTPEPSPTSGETTTDPAPSGPAAGTVLLNEDFESHAVGALPSGYDSFIGWVPNPMNQSGAEVVVVGTEQKHGGNQALQVKGGSNPAQLVWKIPAGQNKLYVRSWVYLADRQLGSNPGANHETLIALRDSVGNANSEIRFGEIKGVIGTNEVPTDDISPLMDQWGGGPVIAKGKWVCLEVAFLGDKPYHEVRAWADGELVHEVTEANQWQNRTLTASNWMEGRFVELVFGWHSFSSASNTVWFDDIIVATERVGCN
jgi:hypothetical protein